MAELELPESIRDKFPKLSLRHVLLLQANIRGIIVRSHMKSTREEFIKVFNEIQLKDNLCVFWKSRFLCLPKFTTAKEKEKEPKCFGLKPIRKPDGPREATAMESNFAITKENQNNPCGPCDKVFVEDRLSRASPQPPVKTSDKPVRKDEALDSRSLFSDDRKESEHLLSEFENRDRIHHLPASNEDFERPSTVEQDSEFVKAFVTSDESLQKSSKTTFNKQEPRQALPENKDVCSPDPSNDGKNIDSTNSSSCSKPFEKDNKSESQTLDSTFTDVSSVWDSSVRSLSPSGDSWSDTPCPETVASLQLERQNIVLELVWLQQAILSRKNYLRLKSQMDSS